MLLTEQIRVRDPFIFRDDKRRCYFLFRTVRFDEIPAGQGDPTQGFDCYRSEDLQHWEGPIPAFRPPGGFWATHHFWAPEVHAYKGAYYLFASFKAHGRHRATQIFKAAQPEGPYLPISDGPITPAHWECLDGTLYVDAQSVPWIVFCHEWTQVRDGGVWAMPLSADLTKPAGRPQFLFNASEAPWSRRHGCDDEGGETPLPFHVTDGPWLFHDSDGRLLMMWSSFGPKGYAMGLARSETGAVTGPWRHAAHELPVADGGHAMIFTTFSGVQTLAYHSPNHAPCERAHFTPFQPLRAQISFEE